MPRFALGLCALLLGCAPPALPVPPLDPDALRSARRCHQAPSPTADTRPAPGTVPVRIRLIQRLGTSFRRVHADFTLSGTRLCRLGPPEQRSAHPEPVLHAHLPPGRYRLDLSARFRGHGLGVFSYLRGYKFHVRSAHDFTVHERTPLHIDIELYERGTPRTPLAKRLAVRYRTIAR